MTTCLVWYYVYDLVAVLDCGDRLTRLFVSEMFRMILVSSSCAICHRLFIHRILRRLIPLFSFGYELLEIILMLRHPGSAIEILIHDRDPRRSTRILNLAALRPFPYVKFMQEISLATGVLGIAVGIPQVDPFGMSANQEVAISVIRYPKCLQLFPQRAVIQEGVI